MSKSTQNRYSQKCEMNRECRLMLKFLGLNPRRDVFILSASTQVDEEKWNGLVKTVKENIKLEIHHLRECIMKTMGEVKVEVDQVESGIQEEVVNAEDKVTDNVNSDIGQFRKNILNIKDGIKEQTGDLKV